MLNLLYIKVFKTFKTNLSRKLHVFNTRFNPVLSFLSLSFSLYIPPFAGLFSFCFLAVRKMEML